MARLAEELPDGRLLDDLPRVHDDDAARHRRHHAEVVGDEQDRRARGSAEVAAGASRICAWMVTSSAVVGSSAIRSRGRHASAIAIMTRWRMPPESWCG